MKTKKLLYVLVPLCVLGYVVFHHSTRVIDERDLVAGEIVVDFKDDVSPETINALGKKLGVVFKPESSYSSVDKIYLADGIENEDEVLDELRGEGIVEAADKEEIYTIPEHNLPADVEGVLDTAGVDGAGSFPNDPRVKEQWALTQIHMPSDWDKNAGSDVLVCILDTGLSRTQDLKQTKIVPGYNFVDDNEDTTDRQSHGSFVSGCVAQSTNNGVGVAGVAYKATIMPVKVLSDQGSGSTAGIAEGIRYAADKGCRLINLSLGGSGRDAVLENAVKYARSKGTILIAASGNSSRGVVSYPAKYDGVIAVAATQRDEKTTFYSNWGKEIAISAPGGKGDRNHPGENVLQNTIVNGKDDYYFMAGTSFSSPYVAGVAALIVGAGISDPDEVKEILTKTARVPKGMDGSSKSFKAHYGAGIVDASAAVKAAHDKSGGLLHGTHWYWYVLFLLGAFVVYAMVKRAAKK